MAGYQVQSCQPPKSSTARDNRMDSEIQRDGRLMDVIDDEWRKDKLPVQDIMVPVMQLPETEPDNGPSIETPQEQEQKWTDLGLASLRNQPSLNSTSNS